MISDLAPPAAGRYIAAQPGSPLPPAGGVGGGPLTLLRYAAAMPATFLELLTYYLIAINFVAFAAFGIDKALAEGGGRRVSEGTLLQWAVLGGTPGAYAGRRLFRHKTRKQPFSSHLHTVAVLQVVVLVVVAGYLWLA